MLEASNLEVVFNPGTPLENRAVRDLSLSIDEGEFVTVIGTNGAGKSTMLSSFAGDVRPSSGAIVIDGRDVTSQNSAKRARQLGRVFQDPRMGTCEELTILENLAVAAARTKRRGFGHSVARSNVEVWRDRLSELGLGLESRLGDKVGLLSGGQRQALSLLMACLVPNRALLLDEHTAALDPSAADNVMQLTDKFAERERLTVLMVTHSMSQALQHGSRTIMLHEGSIMFDLSSSERASLGVPGLLDLFKQVRGRDVDDDSMVLE